MGKKSAARKAPRTTAQLRSARLLRLEHGIALRLAEAAAPKDALTAVLAEICRVERWDLGELWCVDEVEGVLRRTHSWMRPQFEAARRFVESSEGLTFKPGAGIAGLVWKSGKPEWIADTARDRRVLRKSVSAETGLHAALLYPVRYAGQVVGVLSFTCARIRRPDRRLLQSLAVIASQVGQFLQRMRAEQTMRESEARFRSLTHLSSDWYWELDAAYRITRLEGRHVTGGDRQLYQRLMGRARWDTGLEVEAGWDAHRALLEARRAFHDVLMWRPMADGSLRYLRVSGEPVFDAAGKFAGYRGVGRDVTAQWRAERLLRLEHDIARALSVAPDVLGGVREVMRAVCQAEEWACARYLEIDEAAGALVMRASWSVDDPAVRAFIERSVGVRYRRGEGISGHVWASGRAVWSADAQSDPRVHPGRMGEGTPLHGVFAFPVSAGGTILGVLAFASQAVRQPDERLLAAGRMIGTQVAEFVQRMRAEQALRESEARFRSLTQMSSDFFWETDTQHRFTQMVHGPNYVPKFAYEIVGRCGWDLPIAEAEAPRWAQLRAAMDAHEVFRDFEFSRPTAEGGRRYFSVSGEPRFAPDGAFLGYRGVGRETTEIALAREHISSLAFSDALTGLSNRSSLGPAFEQAVERARRRGGKLAALFVDLDGFKAVNDAHGHQAGDRILVEVARRLRANVRASDLIARLGGDEFFLVLEDLQGAGPLEAIAQKLLAEIARPYPLAPGTEARISASIGVALFPDHAANADALMRSADIAMYEAKEGGKNRVRFYSADGTASRDRSVV